MSSSTGATLHGNRDVEPLGMTDLKSQGTHRDPPPPPQPGATG